MKKIGLGKGLEGLLGATKGIAVGGAGDATATSGAEKTTLPILQLQAGRFQPRQTFDEQELQTLAESIKRHGLIQAIVVRPIADNSDAPANRYEIVAGERRFRAAGMAGLTEVPVAIRDISDEQAQIFALVENLQRADLNPMEQARGLDNMATVMDLTHQQVGDMVGKSRPQVSNLLRLLDLHPNVQQLLEKGELEIGHARPLLGLPVAQHTVAARQIIAKAMSTRATEIYVKKLLSGKGGGGSGGGGGKGENADTVSLSAELSKALAMRVEIKSGKKGSGKMIIHYGSLTSLDKLINTIKK